MSKKSLDSSFILVVLGLAFIALLGLRTISTPEIWTHLAQGQNNEPISYLAADTAVNTTWLYDKLAYTFWSIGGAPLLIILNIAGLLITFSLLIMVSKKWGGGMSQGFALLFAGHLIFQSLDVGPGVCMMLFIALTLFLLDISKTQAMLFGTLIPLQIIWTNTHGSFFYGPIITALTAWQAAQNTKGPKKARKKGQELPARTIGILAMAMLLATLANPYFFKMHLQVLAGIKSAAPFYRTSLFVDYFQIPALKPLIFFLMILGACGLITLKKKLPLVLTTLAIFGAFVAWTPPHRAMLFAALSFPFVVLSLTAISEYLHQTMAAFLGKNGKILTPITGGVLAILLILSMLPIVSNSAYVKTGSASNFGLGAQENLYPNDCEAIFEHPDFPASKKTINLAADGGYLAFKYGRKCFIDYRPGRYSFELLNTLNHTMLGSKKDFDKLNLEFRPEAFVINTLAPSSAQGLVTLLIREGWKMIYFDGTTAILLQNKEGLKDLINNPKIQQAGLNKLEKARADYAAKQKGNPAELIGSGKIFLAMNRPTESKAIFALLLKGNGNIPGAWIGLGNSQLMLREYDAAVQSLETAIKLSPNSIVAWRSYALANKLNGNNEAFEQAVEKVKKLQESIIAQEVKKEDVTEEPPPPIKDVSIEEMTVPGE